MLRFRLYAFVEAAALRPIVLRYASAPIATRVSFPFLGDVAFFESFVVPFPLSLCMESTSYVLSFMSVFFYLVTTSWIFDVTLCENSIIQSNVGSPRWKNLGSLVEMSRDVIRVIYAPSKYVYCLHFGYRCLEF